MGRRPQNGQDLLREAVQSLSSTGGHTTAWDDVSGAPLNVEAVMEARKVEINYFKSMQA